MKSIEHTLDPCPAMPFEDEVGTWANEKHRYLLHYVNASAPARRRYLRDSSYIDLFSGPGRLRTKGSSTTRDSGAVIAWRAAQATRSEFKQVLIADKDPVKLSACEARLRALGAPVQAFEGPAIETVDRVLDMLHPTGLHLAYLDPYNLSNLSFSVIQKLAKSQRIDFALHWSVMDMQRNVELEFDKDSSRFDAVAPGWRDAVRVDSLSKTQARDEFFRYWCGLVEALGFKIADRKPLVRDEKNSPLYRLVFLSRHPLADRLWNDVAKGPNRELFE